MMAAVERRGQAVAAARAAAVAVRIAAAAGEVPGVSAEAGEAGVVLSGRALGRRRLTDPRLRWIGGAA